MNTYVKIGSRHYIPLDHVLRFEIDIDCRVKVYLREMIGPFPRYIKTPRFYSYEEAEEWIYKSMSKN